MAASEFSTLLTAPPPDTAEPVWEEAANLPPRRFPSRRLTTGAVLLGLAALAGVVVWWQRNARQTPIAQFARLERGNIEANISATGACNAVVTVQVGSQVSGNIMELLADFNTEVKRGQPIARIDPQVFQARVNHARAGLESAQASMVNARAQVARARAQIESDEATLDNQTAAAAKAKAAVVEAERRLARRLELFERGILSPEDRDTAQANYDQAVAQTYAAVAQVDGARHVVQSAEAERRVAETQLSLAQALVKQTQATLDQAQIDLDHTFIRAPVDGTVIARHMDVGQTVAASFQAPTIFDIAQDLRKMQVDASVDEADIGQVHPGQAVVFNVDAHPGVTFHGTVSQIRQSPLKVQNVITYDVVVTVASEGPKLFPGMTANVRIALGRAEDVLKIPNLALRFRPAGVRAGSASGDSRRSEGQTVWVLGSDRKLKPVTVKVGLSDGVYTEIVAGDLHAGDQVAVGNAPGARAATPPPMPGRGPRI